MKFDILNKFTDKVIFTTDIECGEDELPSIQLGLAVKCAVENHANLSYANLSSADLSATNLRYADLVVILLPLWTVYVQSEYTRIGCKYFKNSEWLSFTDEEIAGMDSQALEWWNKYKPIIETTIKSLN